MKPGREKFESLEMVRALAALSVVFFHTQIIFTGRTGIVPFGGVFGAGSRGVDLFFVLSGFIIAYIHAGDLGRPGRVGHYFYSRFVRIYPSVWITTLLALAVYLVGFGGPDKADKLQPWSIAASFLLLPQHGDALVNVTWSLKYEIFFYLLFALAILRRGVGLWLILLWQAAVLAVDVSGRQLEWSWGAFYLRPIVLEFGLGLISAWVVINRARFALLDNRRFVTAMLALGTTVFVAAELTQAYAPAALEALPDFLVFGVSAALIVVSLAVIDIQRRYTVPRVLVMLGGASYSIYLVHFSTISLLAAFLTKGNRVPMNDAVFLAVALVGITFGLLFHQWIDRPIHRFLRKRERVTPPAAVIEETMPPAIFVTKDAAPI
ncbi:MAG TPA: acyltransferase [Alphaproteobacteria bacterium]|jgi:peptidoglycan/LPS O-acetylase OafA/YrhL|nr:acyltransferase [Alphaproteobacteria bacterium]